MSVYLVLVILLFSTNTCRITAQVRANLPTQALSDDEIQQVLLAKLAKNKGKTVAPKIEEDEPKVIITPSQKNHLVSDVDTTNFDFTPYTGGYKPFDLRSLVLAKQQRPEASCNHKEKTLVCPSAGTYICISPEQLCDTKRDCPDGADERPTHCMFSRLFAEYDQLLEASMRKVEANVALSNKNNDRKARQRKLRNKNKTHAKRHLTNFYDMY